MHKIQAIFYMADIIIATDNLISNICFVNDQMYILDIPRSKLRNQNRLQTLTLTFLSSHIFDFTIFIDFSEAVGNYFDF